MHVFSYLSVCAKARPLTLKLVPLPDVFNTEGHPYVAPAAKAVYGSGKLYPQPPEPFKTDLGSLPLVSPLASQLLERIPAVTGLIS